MPERIHHYTANFLLDDLGKEKAIERVTNNIVECRKLGEKEEREYWENVLEVLNKKEG